MIFFLRLAKYISLFSFSCSHEIDFAASPDDSNFVFLNSIVQMT